MVGSEVPRLINARRDICYVVHKSQIQLKRPALIKRLIEGSSKVNIKRNLLEFGISRNTYGLGKRRIHSTIFICGKVSSSKSLSKYELSGLYGNKEIDKLIFNTKNNSECSNLSKIISNPDFLKACWVKIRSNKGALTLALETDTLDGIKDTWFTARSNEIINGKFSFKPYRRVYIPKPNGKLRPLTMPDPKDKILQEAMRFLLDLVFEPHFRISNQAHRTGKGCHTALHRIRRIFGGVIWYIEGDIEQQFPTIDHHILINFIKEKVKDQAFIDLLWKYLRAEFKEKGKPTTKMKVGLVQGGILSPLLSNIYMHQFDAWMEDYLIPKYTKGKCRRMNPVYRKLLYDKLVPAKFNVRRGLGDDPNFKRVKYVRYVDDFLIGVIGSKSNCIVIRKEIKDFLEKELELTLNVDKTKITHSLEDHALFLGYRIHGTKGNKLPTLYKDGKLQRRSTRPILDAPLDRVIKRLIETGYAKPNGNPTRNGKFIHLSLPDLIEHFRSVERGILNYYGLANNYGRVAARTHYILKYSCALTICSKMKLRTLKRTFSKYGRDLFIKDDNGEIIRSYPVVSYKRPNQMSVPKDCDHDDMIWKLTYRIGRGRKDLTGPCTMCGSKTKN